MRVVLLALLFAALLGSAVCQDPIVTNDEGDLATNTQADSDSEEMPNMSQFEDEEILLNSKDVFQGSTLLQLLPDIALDNIDQIIPAPTGSNDTECCKCTEFAAKKVLEHVIAHVKQMCDQTKCPHIKKHCEWMGKHPKFALGTMIYHVRPHSLGFSYCLGKGKCHHYQWDEVTERAPLIVDPLSAELLVEMAERNRTFSEEITADLTDEDVAELEERIREMTPDDDDNVAYPTDESCHKCVHWVSLHVVKRHIEGFIELCKKTKCPKIKEHCKWAFHNFSLWLGFNTAWIRPEEFSYGYCVGKDACSPRYRHRHSPEEFQQ